MNIAAEHIESKLNLDVNIIIDGILNAMPLPPIAMYLCGGHGRQEGSWFIDENKKIMPYNDYDIAVISNHAIGYLQLQNLRIELAKKLSIHWVDIDFYSIVAIKNLSTTIHNVDLIYASRLIWGKDYLRENAPRLKPENIGRRDIDILYRTRMWTLLGSWSGRFHTLYGEEARFFKNQMAKCILAACDMILVSNHKYTTSYKERVEIAKTIKSDVVFSKMSDWAIQEKLFPTADLLPEKQMIEFYNKARKIFFDSFTYSYGEGSRYYMKPELSYRIFRNGLKYSSILFLSFFLSKYKLYRKNIDIFCAQNYVLHAYSPDNINIDYLSRANEILKKWGYGTYVTWDELREAVANARNNI